MDLTIITGGYHSACYVMDICSGDLTIITSGYHSACFVMDKCSGYLTIITVDIIVHVLLWINVLWI